MTGAPKANKVTNAAVTNTTQNAVTDTTNITVTNTTKNAVADTTQVADTKTATAPADVSEDIFAGLDFGFGDE